MNASLFTAATLLLLPACVGAQTMYRCGNTFSQQPCGSDAKPIATVGVVQPERAADPAKVSVMQTQCEQWVREKPSWKDRESVKTSMPTRNKLETRTVNGVGQIVVSYRVLVNAKNSYGAYQGEKTYTCYANRDESKIIDLQMPDE
ncbi:hypothetical protein [Curvibacter phage PCA1]|nr:hypothetical protein [Curvibacter phage PCA1]